MLEPREAIAVCAPAGAFSGVTSHRYSWREQMSQIKYKEITAQIIEQMETHGSHWVKPFNDSKGGLPVNATTGAYYRGINVVLLGFSGGYWASYKQWAERGYQVAKGQKGTRIVFFKKLKIKDDETGEDKIIPMLKTYTVFEASQLNAEVKEFTPPVLITHEDETDRIDAADDWVAATGAEIHHGDRARAYYTPSGDFIHMPNRECFSATETSSSTQCYYSTLFHELTHWTGHKDRTDRLTAARFGSPKYAFEELVAELGAAYQCAMLGVAIEPRPDHAQYLNNWIECLKNEPKAIFKAATLAQEALDYIVNLQPTTQQEAA